jgi:hypothetical protein
MKINMEDYLHKIDSLFKDKEPKEIYMTYIMVVASIFAFSYFLFWDSSFEGFKQTRNDVERLKRDISADKHFLQRNPQIKITQLNNEIKKINHKMLQDRDNNAYIKHKIETISSLIYDATAWGKYLDSITTNAQKYHVKVETITNKYADTGSSFGHILDITVSTKGDFINTVEFINSMEQSELVVDIHDFKITADERLLADFNISVWGIRY